MSSNSLRRLLLSACAVIALAAALAPDSRAATPTVKLLTDTTATSVPGGGRTVARVAATRPLTGAPTVLPVIGRSSADGRPWVRVRLPQRPNGATGWIAADSTVSGRTPWKITVRRSSRTATVSRTGRTVRRFRVVIGAARTPTPTGRFFITETVRQPSGAAVGPYVLATSAYSNVLQEFAGGPGQIGLHGRTGLPDPLGSAASHGCVRFSDDAVRWLAARIDAGTPLTIR